MGFKCPACRKDFGINKAEWERHINESHQGMAKDAVELLGKISGKVESEADKWQLESEAQYLIPLLKMVTT